MYFWIVLIVVALLLIWLFYSGKDTEEFVGLRTEDLENLTKVSREGGGEEKLLSPVQKEEVCHAKEEEGESNTLDDDLLPYHSGKSKKSKGEEICCSVMEKIYGMPFYTVRPNFLKNPETGRNLEIDCYNPELKIGVEYNGKQHYVFPNFTGMSREEFYNQLRRDRFKRETCDLNGVYLITVPYTIKHGDIENYIRERLP
ncbi:hypothetical protein [Cedratvirus kamchatka]|uniref:Helicase nuclease n=1 Tax=Cedratvirus kamchatka TaxID=2716914 RepID=A0A6G8MXD2_9VIRU|nr:hypothetical protein [Cedratvirus kamchatka]